MAGTLISAVADSTNLHRIVCTFSQQVDSDDANDPNHWTVTPAASPAVAVDVVDAVTAPGLLTVEIWVEPPMSPGEGYNVRPSSIRNHSSSSTFATTPALATAPLLDEPESEEWEHGVLRAVTRAFAEELQSVGGTPTTILVADYKPGDVRMFCESLLGFPSSGSVFIGSKKFRYTGKSAQALLEVYPEYEDGVAVPEKSVVYCNQADVPLTEG